MADITAAGTGAAGLGLPAARWVVATVWTLGLFSDVLGGAVAPPFDTEVLALALGLVGGMLLTAPGDDRLSWGRSLLTTVAVVTSGTAALTSGAALGQTWSFNFAAYIAALLIPRGNVLAGLLGGGLLSLVGLGRAVAADASPAQLIDLLALPVLALVIGTAWRWSLHRVVTRELQHEREADRAAIAASITESATSAARLELAEIRAEVSPVLIRLRDGAVLDDAQVQEVAIVEAEVRDRIRSPRLRHERLRTAIASARRRGVHIVLLGSADASGDVIGDDLAAAVALLTDAIDRGSITIRAVPPGRTGALSVLLDAGDRSERLLFDDAGVVIARS